MSANISTAFVNEFTSRVKLLYQSGAKLAATCRTETGVVGSTHRFDTYGEYVMGTHIPLSRVTFSNAAVASVTATLADFNLSVLTSMFDEQKIKWSEVPTAQKAVAMAIGRRVDQIKINALAAATFGGTNSIAYNDFSSINNAMNVAKLRRAARLLDDADVPEEGRHFAMTPTAKEQLLGATPVTSADYNAVRALVNGDVNTFLGFKFHWIPGRTEGGLPLNTGTRRYSFAWHEEALGYAEGIGPRINMKPADEYRGSAIYADLSAGAIAIENAGIIRVEYDEAVVTGAA